MCQPRRRLPSLTVLFPIRRTLANPFLTPPVFSPSNPSPQPLVLLPLPPFFLDNVRGCASEVTLKAAWNGKCLRPSRKSSETATDNAILLGNVFQEGSKIKLLMLTTEQKCGQHMIPSASKFGSLGAIFFVHIFALFWGLGFKKDSP